MGRFIDLTGQKFGNLTVIGRSGVDNVGNVKWECVCDCGNKTNVVGVCLRKGIIKSCGCLKREHFDKLHTGELQAPIIDLTGKRFGRLVVVKRDTSVPIGLPPKWICKCDCGNEKSILGVSLRVGRTNSCGCILRTNPYRETRLFKIWKQMKSRCELPSDYDYQNYGARGITVCNEWQEFLVFKEWAESHGYAQNLTIDRIDVNNGYSPENCRWATAREQNRNKRNNHMITYNGETHCLMEWCEILGFQWGLLNSRINTLGWDIERAFTTPKRNHRVNH